MPERSTAGVPRRRFLGQVAATLAAGFGFAAAGSTAVAAALRPAGTQSCAIYCYDQHTSCTGGQQYRCIDYRCGTDDWYACFGRIGDFCYSTNAC